MGQMAQGTQPAPRRSLAEHYLAEIASDPRRERMFIGALAFAAGFIGARTVTHAIRAGVGPFRNLSVGGRHLHHMVFGIGGLLTTGYLWLLLVGSDPRRQPRASRRMAAAYGVASALTLDEFALWLDLRDVYWAKQGRRSVDAVIVFGNLLSIGLWGGPLFRAIARELGRVRQKA